MPKLPRDRVVVVTGASTGIGRGAALAFAKDGARVVVAARNAEKLEQVARECGGLAVPTDVTKRGEVARLIRTAHEKFGAVHVLVNNAGRGLYAKVEDMREEDFDAILRLNVYGPLYGIQEVLPVMKKQGCGQIINITSTLGRVSMPLMAAYCMSKFAFEALSESLRTEVKPYGIHVIVVGPGVTRTDFQKNALRTGVAYDEVGGPSAERVGRAILRASKWRRRNVYLNLESKALLAMHAISPRLVDFGFGVWMRQQVRPPANG